MRIHPSWLTYIHINHPVSISAAYIKQYTYSIKLIYDPFTAPCWCAPSSRLHKSHSSINPNTAIWNRPFDCSRLGINYCWYFPLEEGEVNITVLYAFRLPFKITRLSIYRKPPDKYFNSLRAAGESRAPTCAVEGAASGNQTRYPFNLWCSFYVALVVSIWFMDIWRFFFVAGGLYW